VGTNIRTRSTALPPPPREEMNSNICHLSTKESVLSESGLATFVEYNKSDILRSALST
jgi:hypothetical protein